jgi:hypothetical protein
MKPAHADPTSQWVALVGAQGGEEGEAMVWEVVEDTRTTESQSGYDGKCMILWHATRFM